MIVHRFEADEENNIYIKYMIRPLIFGLYKGKVCFWAVTDPLNKSGQSAKIICVKDEGSIEQSAVAEYRVTLTDEKTDTVWHLFEEVSKIIKGKPLIDLGKQ